MKSKVNLFNSVSISQSYNAYSNSQETLTYEEQRIDSVSIPIISESNQPKTQEKNLSLLDRFIESHDNLLNILAKYANNPDKIPTLHYAVKMGDENAVSILLDNGMCIDKCSSLGTPIQIAFRQKNMSMIKHLIDRGAPVDTFLIEDSIINQFDEGIELLLHSGIDPSRCKTSLVIDAINRNDEAVVETFVKLGFDLKKLTGDVLFKAVENRNISSSLIKLLISSGISCEFSRVNQHRLPFPVRDSPVRDSGGKLTNGDVKIIDSEYSLMTAAVNRGDISIVSMLIERKSKFNHSFHPTISFACLWGSGWRGSVEITEDLSSNPLYCAVKSNRSDIAELLLEHGAELIFITRRSLDFVSIPTGKEWRDWCHYNVQQKPFVEGINNLTKKIDQLAQEINTVEYTQKGVLLMTAIQMQNPQMVRLLLEAGHPIEFIGDNGTMPMKFAVEMGNREVIALLLMHGATWDGV